MEAVGLLPPLRWWSPMLLLPQVSIFTFCSDVVLIICLIPLFYSISCRFSLGALNPTSDIVLPEPSQLWRGGWQGSLLISKYRIETPGGWM